MKLQRNTMALFSRKFKDRKEYVKYASLHTDVLKATCDELNEAYADILGMRYELPEHWWVAEDKIGTRGCCVFEDEWYINENDLKYLVENNVERDEFLDWYDYDITIYRARQCGHDVSPINLSTWHETKGSLGYDKETLQKFEDEYWRTSDYEYFPISEKILIANGYKKVALETGVTEYVNISGDIKLFLSASNAKRDKWYALVLGKETLTDLKFPFELVGEFNSYMKLAKRDKDILTIQHSQV